MTTPALTDRAALLAHRARARRTAGEDALFLHEAARAEIEERLAEVNRRFTSPAIIGPFPEVWADLLPKARHVADAAVLDLGEGAHDIVIHAMALHWADDPVGQLIQARRALVPDGLFIAVAFGGQTLQELRRVMAETESQSRGGLSPRVAPMAEIRDLGGLLQRSGLALPVADNLTLPVRYRSMRHLVRDLRAMGEGNALAARDPRPLSRAELTLAEDLYARHFPAGDDRIAATFELIFLTGWAPAPDQPKPLRPGSAAQRLADALGTRETPTGDPARPDRD